MRYGKHAWILHPESKRYLITWRVCHRDSHISVFRTRLANISTQRFFSFKRQLDMKRINRYNSMK